MFINKSTDGKLNICGDNIKVFRKQMKLSQRELADRLQLIGIDLTKNTVQRIEKGERFVIDIELKGMAKFFGVSTDDLIG